MERTSLHPCGSRARCRSHSLRPWRTSSALREGRASSAIGQPAINASRRFRTRFYRAQAMRLSVWDKPRRCDRFAPELSTSHCNAARLPRCRAGRLRKLNRCDLRDGTQRQQPIDARFVGTLRADQGRRRRDAPITTWACCAPQPAFGKTVTAATMIARRGVNTLVLVHRTELLKRWQERLPDASWRVWGCGQDHRRAARQSHRQRSTSR